MSIREIGFWIGFIELGFVLYAVTPMGELLFGLWGGFGCFMLMWCNRPVKGGKP